MNKNKRSFPGHQCRKTNIQSALKGHIMVETLIGRITRIISGNIHDAIEALETHEAETIMRQAIREIDQTICEVKNEARKANGNRLLAKKRLDMTDTRLEELSEKAQLAIKEDREDLAEAVISKQLDLEAQIPVLKKAVEAASTKNAEYESYVEALRGRKSEMEDELENFVAMRKETAEGIQTIDAVRPNRIEDRVEMAVDAFDKAIKRSGSAVGYTASDRGTAAKLSELEGISRQNQITERLEALRSKSES